MICGHPDEHAAESCYYCRDTPETCPCADLCDSHAIPRPACSGSVHYTPAQARAYVDAIMSHPDAKRAHNGGAVPRSLL